MQIVVLCNDSLKEELTAKKEAAGVVWIKEISEVNQYPEAAIFIDLLFEPTGERMGILKSLLPRPVIINSVLHTLNSTDTNFIRINGWPTFLKGSVVEGSAGHEHLKKLAGVAFALFGKEIEWLPDITGFVTPRVVSMIINEAYHARAEGVSTEAEIDTALKLGTAYPFGPFEWSKKIGLANVALLLQHLSKEQPRYTPHPQLVQEAGLT